MLVQHSRNWPETTMRSLLILLMTALGLFVFAGPAAAEDKCGYALTGKWGLLYGNSFVLAGDASVKSCKGMTLTLEGDKGIVGARPEDIMTAQGAASFETSIGFLARSFVPEDADIATGAGKMPWQIFPTPDQVTASETQLAIRMSDGLADTVFFRVSHGELCFLQVRAVTGNSYNDLLEGGDLLSADL